MISKETRNIPSKHNIANHRHCCCPNVAPGPQQWGCLRWLATLPPPSLHSSVHHPAIHPRCLSRNDCPHPACYAIPQHLVLLYRASSIRIRVSSPTDRHLPLSLSGHLLSSELRPTQPQTHAHLSTQRFSPRTCSLQASIAPFCSASAPSRAVEATVTSSSVDAAPVETPSAISLHLRSAYLF